jgi:hypothetical protein
VGWSLARLPPGPSPDQPFECIMGVTDD